MKLFLKFKERVELVLVEFCFGQHFASLLLVVPEVWTSGLGFEFLDLLG